MNTLNANENLMEIVKNMDALTEKEIFEKLGKYVRKETIYPIDQIYKYVRENYTPVSEDDEGNTIKGSLSDENCKEIIFKLVNENIFKYINLNDEKQRMLVASHFAIFETAVNDAIERFKKNNSASGDIPKLAKKICLVTNEGTKNKRNCLQNIISEGSTVKDYAAKYEKYLEKCIAKRKELEENEYADVVSEIDKYNKYIEKPSLFSEEEQKEIKDSKKYKIYIRIHEKYKYCTLEDEKFRNEIIDKMFMPEKPAVRSISRYQALLFAFIFNMDAETAETIILKKALMQQGFNIKHPIDAMCYIALSQSANKYLTFLRLFESFKKQSINKLNEKTKNSQTIYNSDRMIIEDLSTATDEKIESTVERVIENLYFNVDSAEIQKLFAEKSSVKGVELLEFCLNKNNSNRVDCLSSNSVSSYEIFKKNFGIKDFNNEDELCDLLAQYDNTLEDIDVKLGKLRSCSSQAKNLQEHNTISKSLYNEYVAMNDKKVKDLLAKKENVSELRSMISEEGLDRQDETNLENIDWRLNEKMNITNYSNSKAKGLFGERVLNVERLKKICVEKSIPVSRDDIITSSFYNFSTHKAQYKDLTFEERFKQFEEQTNDELLDCGYMPLYYPNFYEFVLAALAATSSPDEFFKKLVASIPKED